MASDTIENLSLSLRGSHKLSIRVEGPAQDALEKISKLPEVKKAEILGSREPDTVDIYVESDGEKDVRKPVFLAMSRAQYPILVMKSMDLTLEDIFLQLTTDEKTEGQEVS